jgi:hypothetical protein
VVNCARLPQELPDTFPSKTEAVSDGLIGPTLLNMQADDLYIT